MYLCCLYSLRHLIVSYFSNLYAYICVLTYLEPTELILSVQANSIRTNLAFFLVTLLQAGLHVHVAKGINFTNRPTTCKSPSGERVARVLAY